MHSSIALPALYLLVLSRFAAALPQNSESTFNPQHDGAPAGCHAVDFVKTCLQGKPLTGAAGGKTETQQEQANRVAASCGDTCWPAVYGDSPGQFNPDDCAVSCYVSIPSGRCDVWLGEKLEIQFERDA